MNAGPSEFAGVTDLAVRTVAQEMERGWVDRVTDPVHRAVAEDEMAAGRMGAAELPPVFRSGLILHWRPVMIATANVVVVARVHVLVVARRLARLVPIRIDVLLTDHDGVTGAVADMGHLDFTA